MATRRISEFLDGNRVKYVTIMHSPAYTAREIAATTHIPGHQWAKTVIVNIDGVLAMAVVPAHREVDMSALRAEIGADFVELADRSELADRFEGCQLGMMPPFGNLFGMDTYVDRDIAKLDRIVFNAGTHTDAIAMKFADYRRIVHPRLLKIASQSAGAHAANLQL